MRPSIQVFISDLSLAERVETTPAVGEAVLALKKRSIPIVLCTTSTFEEAVSVRVRLGLTDPFIVENGGAIYFRKDTFTITDIPCDRRGEYQRISLGMPYGDIVLYFALLRVLISIGLVGFSDLTDEKLADESGMSLAKARMARRREYDEPFRVTGNVREALVRIERTLKGSGLVLSKGNRYFHLTGGSDQGRAIAMLRRLYQERYGPASLMAVGASSSDASVLESVDRPVIIANKDGRHLPRFADRLPSSVKKLARKAKNWEEAMNGMLHDRGGSHDI